MAQLDDRFDSLSYETTRFSSFVAHAQTFDGEELRAALDRCDNQLTIMRQHLRLVRSSAVPLMRQGKAGA